MKNTKKKKRIYSVAITRRQGWPCLLTYLYLYPDDVPDWQQTSHSKPVIIHTEDGLAATTRALCGLEWVFTVLVTAEGTVSLYPSDSQAVTDNHDNVSGATLLPLLIPRS